MIKNRYCLIIVGCFILQSCNQNKQSSNLPISEQELLNIMVDLTLAQAAVTNFPSSQKDSMRNVYKYQLEGIYNRSIIEIDSILDIVYNDAALNKKLQKSVLDSLKVLEEKTNKTK